MTECKECGRNSDYIEMPRKDFDTFLSQERQNLIKEINDWIEKQIKEHKVNRYLLDGLSEPECDFVQAKEFEVPENEVCCLICDKFNIFKQFLNSKEVSEE